MNILCQDYIKSENTSKPCLYHVERGYCSHKEHFACIEHIRRKETQISHSKLSTYKRCRRCYYYTYILGLQRKVPQINMEVGNLFHIEMSILHEIDTVLVKKYQNDSIDYRTDLVKKYRNIETSEVNLPKELRNIDTMIEVYPTLNMKKPKALAERWASAAINDIHILAKLDLQIENENRETEIIYDWKWSGNPDFYTHFTTRHQAAMYFLLKEKAQSITFRCFRKPALKYKHKETEDQYYHRVKEDINDRPKYYINDKTFYRSEYDLDELLDEITFFCNEILENIEHGIKAFPQEDSGCWAYSSWCDYLPICQSKVISDTLYEKKSVGEIDVKKEDENIL